MKTSFIVIGIILTLFLSFSLSYVSAANLGNRSEQLINAAYEDNQNILAQYGQKVQESAGVTTLQRDDLIAVFTGANSSRYGNMGSRATIQWIQEQNPNLDQKTYFRIQEIIEAGRNEFQAAQTRLVDSKRSYRTNLGSFWSGMWLSIAGYPKIRIGYPIGTKDDYPAISTQRANDAFRTGREEGPIKLR